MGRPTNEQAAASRAIGATPNFSVWGGGVGTGLGYELFNELSGQMLLRDMWLMADTDETVGAMLYCISSTMRPITWTYVPQTDGQDTPEDAEAKKWADLATSMMKDMDQPFPDHVEDMLTMIWAGFAAIEIVTKVRDGINSRFNDRYYGIRSLNLLAQTSIIDWVYKGNDMVALRQASYWSSTGSGGGEIPLFKTLLYRTTSQYNTPYGRPLLKNAWRVWRLKRKVQDSEAIGIERDLCGLPVFEMPEEIIEQQFETLADNVTPTPDALKAQKMVSAAQAAVQDMRLNKSGGLVIPSNTYADDIQGDTSKRYTFRIQTTGGQRSIDARTAARDYDHAIARVGMMQFLTLGQRSGGSYGLSEDQSSMAVAAIMALADKVCDEWNAKAVTLIWNINAFPQKYRPRLRHSDVNKNGIVQLGQFLGGIGKAADLWAGDPKMRVSIAKAGNLDYDYQAQVDAANSAQEAADLAANPPTPPAGGMPAPGNAPPAARRRAANNED